ncbi:MAG TPA: type II toxin-antitoxin system prevent-host-death family antitoxin [Planctomycetota bacterium]|nr:type II toxin-antitoxin system prevent-host-death family antitoxin [Planctomycetota bacterium]
MNTINAKQARKQLGELIDAAERGESVVITRRGKRVAEIGPVRSRRHRKMPDLSEFRASVKVNGRSMSDTVIAMRAEERY